MENHEDPLVPQSGLPLSYQPWTLKNHLKDHKSSSLGMAMRQVFSGTRPTPNGTGFNFNKRVWDGFENFFLTRGGFGYCPVPPRPDYI